ncbi:MAG: 8-amino-7-oxononanoate synthase [Bacteroidota bacterium]
MAEDRWEQKLGDRVMLGNFRKLKVTTGMIDFVSNDYLGLARNNTLYELVKMRMDEIGIPNKNGSGGSRLLSGNSTLYENLELYLAEIFKSESTLVFNSGYQANLALVSAVPQKGDTIIYDQLSHVCLKEGAWLSKAESVMFAHNDLEDLERKLNHAKGDKYVVLETVYSMDGDKAPLYEMIDLCKSYQAKIIIDEAHSTGVVGEGGNGLCCDLGREDDFFARVYTFGKAMGVHGACVACSNQLREYLINFARPFIYTTALPLHSVISIEQSFQYLQRNMHLQSNLNELISFYQSGIRQIADSKEEVYYPGSDTAIQPLIIPGNERIRAISDKLGERNLDVRPILSPTVKKGSERLRISLHIYNTKEEIELLLEALNEFL